MRKRLTDAMVERQRPPATGRLEIFDDVVPALALRVTAAGARSFVVRGRVKGEPAPIRLTLGDATVMKLTDARQAASDALRAMRAGNDPREEKKARVRQARVEKALTFDALINEWMRLHLSQRRPRYANEAVQALRRGLPDLIERPAVTITKSDVVNGLDRIALTGRRVAAARIKQYGRACYSWAMKRGKIEVNPFAGLPMAPEKSERERVLSDEELHAIWAAAGMLGYPWAGFYQLSILTLQRREEVAGMRWSELADDLSEWRIPGDRMKTGAPHTVHLSEPARAVLRALPRIGNSDYVFTTTGRTHISGYSKAKRYLDAAITKADAKVAEWVPHDLRRTGVTVLARLGFDSIIVDKLLAHQPGKLRGVAGVYQRYDFSEERATALDAWAAHVTGTKAENVVPLRAAQ
jgi:integrase